MNVSIIGAGYVGLVTGSCLSELGNNVICVDNDAKKIQLLKKGIVPIFEPGLKELIKRNVSVGRLKFTSKIGEAVKKSEIIFIAVGTPPQENGEADLRGVENVARNIAVHMDGYRLIVEKSTVPVETGSWVKNTITTYVKKNVKFDVASNPEFLREGSAIEDFMHPDRIVLGVESKKAQKLLTGLYKPLNAPFVFTDIKSAELIKHASNSFLATKISFINAVSRICDKVGADVVEVARGIGLDKRIGSSFLDAGIGYGGSCFPKDLEAFLNISQKLGYDFELLQAVKQVNEGQKKVFLQKIKDSLWIIKDKTITVLGLSFKPETDDIRSAPSLDIIEALKQEGSKIKVFDPVAMERAKDILGDSVKYCKNAYDACRSSDCILLITEWPEFRELDFTRIKKSMVRPLVIDGRNIYEPAKMRKAGFTYISIGRK